MAIVPQQTEAPQNFVARATSWPGHVKDYVEELHTEMKRVTWPNWKQVRATTTVVIVAVFAFAAYFAVVDELVSTGINRLFTALT